MIAYIRIEVNGLVGIGQVLSLCDECGVPCEILCQKVAISCAPTRRARRRIHAERRADGTSLEVGGTNRNLRSANETQAAVVKIVAVEVIDRMLLCARAHIDVDEFIVKHGENTRHNVSRKVLAHLSA